MMKKLTGNPTKRLCVHVRILVILFVEQIHSAPNINTNLYCDIIIVISGYVLHKYLQTYKEIQCLNTSILRVSQEKY